MIQAQKIDKVSATIFYDLLSSSSQRRQLCCLSRWRSWSLEAHQHNLFPSMRVAAYITEYESKSTGVCEPRFGRLHSHVFPFVYRLVVRGDGRKAEKICELGCESRASCPTVVLPSFDYNPSLPETRSYHPLNLLLLHQA